MHLKPVGGAGIFPNSVRKVAAYPCVAMKGRGNRMPRPAPLFEGGGNAAEGGVEARSEPLDRENDGHRDAGCDQTVFDRRRSGPILQKPNEMLVQVRLLAVPS
jgi:hypothetical protein